MSRLASALLLAALALAPVVAADPPAADPGVAPPAADQQNRGRDRTLQRLIAENPELKDIDPNSPEGKEKIQKVMQARMEKNAPQMRQRMAENIAASHAKLRESLAMSEEDFKAVEPLLTKVENLRLQKTLVDPASLGLGGVMGGRRGGPGGPGGGMFNPQMLLGDTQLDPAVKETQDATKALKTLIGDAQANATELAAAVTRVRKAREAFTTALTKAQEELRSVLTPRQEAILIDQGTLE